MEHISLICSFLFTFHYCLCLSPLPPHFLGTSGIPCEPPGLQFLSLLVHLEFHQQNAAAAAAAAAKSLQLCPTLGDPIDGSPPGSAVPAILQARTLEWVAISFSNAWIFCLKSCLFFFCHSLPPNLHWQLISCCSISTRPCMCENSIRSKTL